MHDHDLLSEDRLTLTELAQERDCAVTTPWRWAQRGVRGVKLETYNEGGRRYTTRQAFRRFCEATTAAAQGENPKSRTNVQREAAINRAQAELAKVGF